jgi:hypothetical protein
VLALGEIAAGHRRQQDILFESAEQTFGRQHFDPWCCELQTERKGIEPPADGDNRRGIRRRKLELRPYVAYAFDE